MQTDEIKQVSHLRRRHSAPAVCSYTVPKSYPALFRNGRLLPVHFDNADKEVFTNIIRHYYPDHVSELDHYDLERLNISIVHLIHHLISWKPTE